MSQPRRSPRLLHQRIPQWLARYCKRLVSNDPDLVVMMLELKTIDEDGAVSLGMALKHNRTVAELLMGWNNIGSRGVTAIASGLGQREVPLQELNLACNQIDHNGVAALVNALGTERGSVLTLNLSHNQAGSSGAQALAKWLQRQNCNKKVNHHLTTLSLVNNAIGNDGAAAFGAALETCGNLKVLDLSSNCNVQAEGAFAISRGLTSAGCGLQTLDLRGTRIGNQGARSLGEALKHNTSLQTLNLSICQIGDTGIESISHGLQDNTSLKTLTLLRNQPSVESAQALLGVLQRQNKALRWVYLVNTHSSSSERAFVRIQEAINYYCALNRAGRKNIGDVTLPWSLWPLFYARISGEANLLYGLVCEKPDLFQRCNISTASTQAVVTHKTRKRPHHRISK